MNLFITNLIQFNIFLQSNINNYKNVNIKNSIFSKSFVFLFYNLNFLKSSKCTFNFFLNQIIKISSNIFLNRQTFSNIEVSFYNSVFTNFSVVSEGSAIYCINTILKIDKCKFINCISTLKGGAIYISGNIFNITNSCFIKCNCLSTSSFSGRCFYGNNCNSFISYSYFIYSGPIENGGDSLFSFTNSLTIFQYSNTSFCFGSMGSISGEFSSPLPFSIIKYLYVYNCSDYCSIATWYFTMNGANINFLNLKSLNSLIWCYEKLFTLSNSIIWNCIRKLSTDQSSSFIKILNIY